jgi:hypothetical protein
MLLITAEDSKSQILNVRRLRLPSGFQNQHHQYRRITNKGIEVLLVQRYS